MKPCQEFLIFVGGMSIQAQVPDSQRMPRVSKKEMCSAQSMISSNSNPDAPNPGTQFQPQDCAPAIHQKNHQVKPQKNAPSGSWSGSSFRHPNGKHRLRVHRLRRPGSCSPPHAAPCCLARPPGCSGAERSDAVRGPRPVLRGRRHGASEAGTVEQKEPGESGKQNDQG